MSNHPEFEKINSKLANILWKKYPDMSKAVYEQPFCDIDGSFLGFVDTYFYLSKVIPKEWTVIDFGCAWNPQAYYFKDHARMISVDPGEFKRWQFENTEMYEMDIATFIKEEMPFMDLNLATTFAICNAVPCRFDQKELLLQTFKNLYLYYPASI